MRLTADEKIEFDDAIEDGDTNKIEAFLKKGLDPNSTLEGTQDPLWWTALRTPSRSAKMVQLFIDYGAKADYATDDGFNALHASIDINGASDDEEDCLIALLLVEHGAHLEQVYTFYGWTPLMHAVVRGSFSEVVALLRAGADPNKKFPDTSMPLFVRGLTILMAAGARPSVLRALLEHGADPNVKNDQGENAIAYFERLVREAEEDFANQDLEAKALENIASKQEFERQMHEDFTRQHGEEMGAQLRKLLEIDKKEKTLKEHKDDIAQAHELYVQDLNECIITLERHYQNRS